MILTKDQITTLKLCRIKAALVEQLRCDAQEAQESICGVKSPMLSGMPGGGASSSAMERAIARRDAADTRLRRAQEEYQRLREKADGIVAGMEDPLAMFAQLYYVCAMSMEETVRIMGRKKRSGWLYKAKIEGEAKED